MIHREGVQPLITDTVLLDTSLGPLVFDLYGADCPQTVRNFCALAMLRYFVGSVVSHIHRDNVATFRLPNEALAESTFTALSTIPSPQPAAGETRVGAVLDDEMKSQTLGVLVRESSAQHCAEPLQRSRRCIRIDRAGLLLRRAGSVGSGEFGVTLANRCMDYLENEYIVFGELCGEPFPTPPGSPWSSGTAILKRINSQALSTLGPSVPSGRPIRLIRVQECVVLSALPRPREFLKNPKGPSSLGGLSLTAFLSAEAAIDAMRASCPFLRRCREGDRAAEERDEELFFGRRRYECDPTFNGEYLSEPLEEEQEEGEGRLLVLQREARLQADATRAILLSMLDGTDATLSAPENVLFVCKLNPHTTGDGLRLCFSQFGNVLNANVVTDRKSGRSLCFAFVEFETAEQCNRAFAAMEGARIDDARVHVDFSQSLAKPLQRPKRKRE